MFGKTPKISKHHLPLSCKNKRNQPPLNHNNLVELELSNTKNRFINTQIFLLKKKSVFTLDGFILDNIDISKIHHLIT